MPVKKKGNKRKGKRKQEKKTLKGNQTISELLKTVRQQYELKCKDEQSYPLPAVKNALKDFEEKSQLLVKVSQCKSLEVTCNLCCAVIENLACSQVNPHCDHSDRSATSFPYMYVV